MVGVLFSMVVGGGCLAEYFGLGAAAAVGCGDGGVVYFCVVGFRSGGVGDFIVGVLVVFLGYSISLSSLPYLVPSHLAPYPSLP